MRASRQEARGRGYEPLVHDGELKEVLGQCSRLQVVVVGLAHASQEAHRTGPTELEAQHAQHKTLRLQNLLARVSVVHHVHYLLERWAVNLFVLGGDEDCCGADKLQLSYGDNLGRQESVDVVDGQEQSLGQEAESVVHLNQPVHENRSH